MQENPFPLFLYIFQIFNHLFSGKRNIEKKNYNSIDLTEVEQFDENDGVRAPGKSLLDLREGLISHTVGKMLNVTVRFHYDKMRRIALENYNYYYAPLPSTPFSLGLAIPVYGNTYIKYENVVSKYTHLGINMTEFFAGQNWKLHPEWYESVVCVLY